MAERDELLDRMTRLEEWTKNHDKNSADHWAGIKDQLKEIKDGMKELVTCKEYNGAVRQIMGLWATVSLAIVIGFGWINTHLTGHPGGIK